MNYIKGKKPTPNGIKKVKKIIVKDKKEKAEKINKEIKDGKVGKSKENKTFKGIRGKFVKNVKMYKDNKRNLFQNGHKDSKENKNVIKENANKEKQKKVSYLLKQLRPKEPKNEKISSVVNLLKKNGDNKIAKNIPTDKNRGKHKLNGQKKPMLHNKDQHNKECLEKNKRTVFVGNIPLKNVTTQKLLKILDIKQSIVESVRFRSLPIDEKYENKKKLGFILKKFTDTKDNKNAFITLKNEEDVQAVLNKTGIVYDGYVLRINRADDNSFFNKKKSICIKNLHKKISEKDLYEILKTIDEIKGIRVLRDNITNCSIGIAFVLFKDRSSVKKAIDMFNGKSINDRQIVVQKIMDKNENDDTNKKKKVIKKMGINKKFKKFTKKKKYTRKKKNIPDKKNIEDLKYVTN